VKDDDDTDEVFDKEPDTPPAPKHKEKEKRSSLKATSKSLTVLPEPVERSSLDKIPDDASTAELLPTAGLGAVASPFGSGSPSQVSPTKPFRVVRVCDTKGNIKEVGLAGHLLVRYTKSKKSST
jgi:hypothetical protein